jgi:hypothetical protein
MHASARFNGALGNLIDDLAYPTREFGNWMWAMRPWIVRDGPVVSAEGSRAERGNGERQSEQGGLHRTARHAEEARI